MRRWSVMGLLGVCLVGCGEEFTPETLLASLRVLGMKSEPASLRPGETASLSARVLDASRPGQGNAVLWLGCDPDPLNLGRTACSNAQTVTEPSSLVAEGSMLPPGMNLLGLNDQAAYSVRPDLFAELPAGDRRRLIGTVGQILALVVAEPVNPLAPREELQAVLERVRRREVASLVVLYRIAISESPEVNENPKIQALTVGNVPLKAQEIIRVKPGQEVEMAVVATEDSFQPFTAYLPESDEPQTERINSAWYSTYGRFKETAVALKSEAVQKFTAPGNKKEPLPEKREGKLVVVLRDTRGGQIWQEFQVFVCDENLPAPEVVSFEEDNQTVTLKGNHLDSVLQVFVGDVPLLNGAYSALQKTYSGELPQLPAGSYPISVRGKHCDDVTTGLSLVRP